MAGTNKRLFSPALLRGWLWSALALCLALVVRPAILLAQPPAPIDVSNLPSRISTLLPDPWETLSFRSIPDTTDYHLVDDPQFGPVIRADSRAGASALTRRLEVDPTRYPELSWSWKISGPDIQSSLVDRGGDDFAARLLVSFKDPSSAGGLPEATLCYVWAASGTVGTMVVSPSHDNVVTIVATSGSGAAAGWQTVRRNLVDDYRQAYGEEPPFIRALSLMTDTDDTSSAATAWYGPISLAAPTIPHD